MSNDNGPEKSRKLAASRSPRFPAYTLETAIQTIDEARKFGRTVTDAQIAGEGSTNSGSFLRKKAALGYYGLISGRGEDVHITDLAESILYPKENERESSIKVAFLTPEIFKRLYQSTAKNVPISLSILGNILIRNYNIQPSAKNEFISVFVRSGIFAGLLNYTDDTKSTIILLEASANDKKQEVINEVITGESSEIIMQPTYKIEDISQPEVQIAELILTNGKAKIMVPNELTSSDTKRLIAQIRILANIIDD